jgi:hypothetical protein
MTPHTCLWQLLIQILHVDGLVGRYGRHDGCWLCLLRLLPAAPRCYCSCTAAPLLVLLLPVQVRSSRPGALAQPNCNAQAMIRVQRH